MCVSVSVGMCGCGCVGVNVGEATCISCSVSLSLHHVLSLNPIFGKYYFSPRQNLLSKGQRLYWRSKFTGYKTDVGGASIAANNLYTQSKYLAIKLLYFLARCQMQPSDWSILRLPTICNGFDDDRHSCAFMCLYNNWVVLINCAIHS